MGKVGLRLADILCDVSRRRALRRKTRVSMDLRLGARPVSQSRAPALALAYFAALAPAAAATPSCCPVPPLAPIAPMILPLTVIGTPPSEAIGGAGKVVKAVLPAAYWSAKILVGRRYMAAVRALPWEISADAIWVPSIFSK